MTILSVIYGKDQHHAIDLTQAILDNYVTDDILFLPHHVDFNSIKYDPYPQETKTLYITYSIGDKANVVSTKEDRFHDININMNIVERNTKNFNNILIYPHEAYQEDDGGLNVMYNFAKILDEMGKTARIYPTYGYIQNTVYNKYFVEDFEIKNSIVVYCEGTHGNPLNAPHVVRWMLSKLGTNVPLERGKSFGKKELVYYFNSELKFLKNPEMVGKIYKNLGLLCINSIIKNNQNGQGAFTPPTTNFKGDRRSPEKFERNGEWCYTMRKYEIHKTPIITIHPENAYEILRYISQNIYVELFNQYTYFISYDPLTFLSIIAALCGCVSVVYPIDGISKKEWVKMTALNEYLEYNNLDYFYGVAYGMEDIGWAISTMHLMKDQWDDIIRYYKEHHISRFLRDMENMEQNLDSETNSLENTVENNYYGEDGELETVIPF